MKFLLLTQTVILAQAQNRKLNMQLKQTKKLIIWNKLTTKGEMAK